MIGRKFNRSSDQQIPELLHERGTKSRDYSRVLLEDVNLLRHTAAAQIQCESSSDDEEESLGCLPGMSF